MFIQAMRQKEWKKERTRGMCHHSCMMSLLTCYLAKEGGGTVAKPLDPYGGFLSFEAKPNMLFHVRRKI